MQISIANPPQLSMYSPEGNLALANALLDVLNLPAHEYPADRFHGYEWFKNWLKTHAVHSVTLSLSGEHAEWTDTEVREMIGWVIENPARGLKYLTH